MNLYGRVKIAVLEENPVPVLSVTKRSVWNGLAWDRSRVSALKCKRLTASAIA